MRAPRRDPHHRREARRRRRRRWAGCASTTPRSRAARSSVDTRVELGGRERSLPLAGSRVDLVVEVPPDVAVEAKTFGGDVSASGPARRRAPGDHRRAHRRLRRARRRGHAPAARRPARQPPSTATSTSTASRATWTCAAWAAAASTRALVDGSIRAEDVRSGLVRLMTTTGADRARRRDPPGRALRPAQLRGRRARLPVGDAAPFELRARSASPVASALPLRGSRRDGDWLRAEYAGPARPGARPRTALLELSSVLGRVDHPAPRPRRARRAALEPQSRAALLDPRSNLQGAVGARRRCRDAVLGASVSLGSDRCASESSPTPTPTSKRSTRCCKALDSETASTVRLPRRHGRLRRQPERVLRDHPRNAPRTPSSATTTPRSPGGWTTRTTTTPPATRSTCTRGCSTPENMEWLKEPAVRGARGRRPLLPRLAAQPRGVRLHLRARAGGAVPGDLGRPGAADVHRPLAPVQVVRAVARRRVRGGLRPVRAPPGLEVHRQRRLGRPAARLRPARQLHDLRHRRAARSSSSASTTTSRPRPRRSSAPSSSGTSATASSSACDGAGRAARARAAACAPRWLAGRAGRPRRRRAGARARRRRRAHQHLRRGRCRSRRRPATSAGSARRWWPGRRSSSTAASSPTSRRTARQAPPGLVALPEPAALGRAAGRRGAQTPKGLYRRSRRATSQPGDILVRVAGAGACGKMAVVAGRCDDQWMTARGGRATTAPATRTGEPAVLLRRQDPARRGRRLPRARSRRTARSATCASCGATSTTSSAPSPSGRRWWRRNGRGARRREGARPDRRGLVAGRRSSRSSRAARADRTRAGAGGGARLAGRRRERGRGARRRAQARRRRARDAAVARAACTLLAGDTDKAAAAGARRRPRSRASRRASATSWGARCWRRGRSAEGLAALKRYLDDDPADPGPASWWRPRGREPALAPPPAARADAALLGDPRARGAAPAHPTTSASTGRSPGA